MGSFQSDPNSLRSRHFCFSGSCDPAAKFSDHPIISFMLGGF
jgi:hypothetical protein